MTASSSDNSKHLDALAFVQAEYALINLSGKHWGINIKQAFDAINTGRQIAFSSMPDLSLMIKRDLKRLFAGLEAKPVLETFFHSPNTICFKGVEFNPRKSTDGYLNLWQGPTLVPKEGNWDIIKELLYCVICNEDFAIYNYLFNYLAHALQRPWEKPGVVILLTSGQGTGKGSFAVLLRKIWGYSFLQVADMATVTGTFNAKLETALLVFMDEAFFVGDRRASDKLKSLITEPVIVVNEKHQPARQVDSYHRFIIATNADHIKHTDRDDRRDFVLRVSDVWQGDHRKWEALHHQIEHGGAQAMMYDLLHADITDFNPRKKPQTKELLNQKLQSLDPVAEFWFDYLNTGFCEHFSNWSDFLTTDWIIGEINKKSGRKLYKLPTAREVSQLLQKMCPSAKKAQRGTPDGRRRGFFLPPLEICRVEFEQYIRGKVDWDEVEDA